MTVAVTFVVGLALVVAGLVLVTVLHGSLVHDIQQVAELHAADIAEASRRGVLTTPIQADDDEIVQVVDSGRVVAASENAAGRPALPFRPPAAVGQAGSEPVAWTVTDPLGIQGQYRLVAMHASPSGSLVVYVANSLKLADQTQVYVRNSLMVGAPLMLAVVAALTWAAVGRALKPVEEIRSQVAEITSRDLSQRVPVPRGRDEIGRLAGTMNAMLERLQSSTERQRRFVADASHELQSPLAAARIDIEVAIAHPDQSSWPETADNLLVQNHQMQHLVADLLFIARAESNRTLAEPRPLDLHEVVLEEVSHLPAVGGVRCDASGVEPAFVSGRREDLARAVRNLIENAVQHASSKVNIGLRGDDGVVRLVVDDDGAGIPPEDRERAFERFSRLDQARNRSNGGTGLGLAIVREIVEQHHGTVTIEDGAVGARFVVTLPAD